MDIRERILKFVKRAIKNRGNPPTLREIAQKFNFSPNTAMYHVNKLKKERRIRTRMAGRKRAARSIKIIR